MKKFLVLSIALSLVFLGSNAFALSLVPEWSFETFTVWDVSGAASAAQSAVQFEDGTKSLLVPAVTTYKTIVSDKFSVVAGQVYSASCKALGLTESKWVWITILWFDDPSGTVANATPSSGPGTGTEVACGGAWTSYYINNSSAGYAAPTGAVQARIQVKVKRSITSESIWVDSVNCIQATTSVDNWKEVK